MHLTHVEEEPTPNPSKEGNEIACKDSPPWRGRGWVACQSGVAVESSA